MSRRRRRSEEFSQGYLLAMAHAVILLHRSGWGSKKRLPAFADEMLDTLNDWQDGGHGYRESIKKLESLTGIRVEKGAER